MKTISFFGHRNVFRQENVYEKLMQTLKTMIPQGFSRLLVGCHGDFDSIALEVCSHFKKQFDNTIQLNVVLTSLAMLHKDDCGNSRADFYKNYDGETIFFDTEEVHFKNRITIANRKMIDLSDAIICYVDMNSYRSGAKKAVQYAIKQNKIVINLYE